MIESLLSAPKKKGTYAINLDWKGAVIGSKDVVDLGGNVWTPTTQNATGQVVNDSSRGKVYRANADGAFSTPITSALFIYGKSFVLEFEALSLNSGSHNLGGSGDYNQGISSGISVNFGQFATNYYQAFLMGPGTVYTRLYPTAAYTSKWTRVVITRTYGSGFKMDLYHDDESSTVPFASASVPEIEIGNGSGYWWLFKSPNTPTNFFNGLLNYYRLTIKD